MTTHAAAASLMDDMEFLTELEQFDPPPTANERVPSGNDLRDLDPARWEIRAAFDDDSEVAPSIAPPIQRIAFGVGGFLLMMSLGAAAAALIFQDRVAHILR